MSIYEYRPLLVFCVIVAAMLGAIAGSFLNCAAWRIVRGESFVRGRSRCPSCGHILGVTELIPVVSWVLSRGRCRYCGEKVSVRYPLTELAFGAINEFGLKPCTVVVTSFFPIAQCIVFIVSLAIPFVRGADGATVGDFPSLIADDSLLSAIFIRHFKLQKQSRCAEAEHVF